jgi:IS30 family transposase
MEAFMASYVRLKVEEREEISRGLMLNRSFHAIARSLGRSPSTISREVGRFKLGRVNYRAIPNQREAVYKAKNRRKGRTKFSKNPKLSEVVKEKLFLLWSPEQIARHLKSNYQTKDMQVSKETIYTHIYVFLRKEMRKEFITKLRHGHKRRYTKSRTTRGKSAKLEDMLSIDERPQEVSDRLIPGHWEGDLMIGGAKEQTALGTLVERTTRFAILVPLKNKSSEEVRKEFAKAIKKLPQHLRLSLTYDQGREMAEHKLFTKDTKMKVYFAHPRSPWERGTNENTNGLLRQYFPKGTNFRNVSSEQIKWAQETLNGRPRKTLGFKTPAEAMAKLLR